MNWRIAMLLLGAVAPTLTGSTVWAQYQLTSRHISDEPPVEAVPPAPANILAAPEYAAAEPPVAAPAAACPADQGGYQYGTVGEWTPPCSFTSYWDYSGGRSPTAYSCAYGYGPDWCHRWEARAEWLIWFSRGRNTPPLVTSSPVGTAQTDAGVLGVSTTTTLYGDDPIGQNARHGLRFTLSRVLNDGVTTATGRFWGLENGAETVAGDSSNRAIIARPFFNTTLGTQEAFLVAYPGLTNPGSMHILSRNNLFGADAWLSRTLYQDRCCTFDLLGGYQFTRMDDSIVINSNSTTIVPPQGLPAGTQIGITDSFRTQNEFHGASLGFRSDFRKDWLSVELLGKIAFGDVRQFAAIDGQTTFTPPGGGAGSTTSGGLYTQGTNIGSYERHRFAVAPELNINGVWHFSPQWKAMVGYSILYWSNAVLAGNQIDPSVNLVQNAGAFHPAFTFQRSDFLVQGINFGVDYYW